MIRRTTPLLLLGLALLLAEPSRAADEDEENEAITAALSSVTIVLDEGYGRVSSLLAKVRAATKINVVTDLGIDPDKLNYSIGDGAVLSASDLLTQGLARNNLVYEGFASVVFITRRDRPNPPPPAIDLSSASVAARRRLTALGSIAILDEPLSEAFEVLSDVTGLDFGRPGSADEKDGLLWPKEEKTLSLAVDDIPAADILRLALRRLGLGAIVRADRVVLWAYQVEEHSEETVRLDKILREPCAFEVNMGSLGKLAAALREQHKMTVHLDPTLEAMPIAPPPRGLSLRSTLFLAPGLASGIDHRVVGDALIFERRSGRDRPPEALDLSEADTTLKVAWNQRRVTITLDGQNQTLGELCAEFERRFGVLKIRCDPALAGARLKFQAVDMRLGALFEHLARLSGARLHCKRNLIELCTQ